MVHITTVGVFGAILETVAVRRLPRFALMAGKFLLPQRSRHLISIPGQPGFWIQLLHGQIAAQLRKTHFSVRQFYNIFLFWQATCFTRFRISLQPDALQQ